jgi:hypothetical protein
MTREMSVETWRLQLSSSAGRTDGHVMKTRSKSEVLLNVCNIVSFYGEDCFSPCPNPKLEGHHLSAVSNCLFNIFAATLHIWRPFLHLRSEDAPRWKDSAHGVR